MSKEGSLNKKKKNSLSSKSINPQKKSKFKPLDDSESCMVTFEYSFLIRWQLTTLIDDTPCERACFYTAGYRETVKIPGGGIGLIDITRQCDT